MMRLRVVDTTGNRQLRRREGPGCEWLRVSLADNAEAPRNYPRIPNILGGVSIIITEAVDRKNTRKYINTTAGPIHPIDTST